jgi:formylglycine-generating enzyme required for sulfatase activity
MTKRFASGLILAVIGLLASAKANDAGWIPAQTFTMGDSAGTGWPDQRPAHTVTLSSFYIAPNLVTVQEYWHFYRAQRRR